MCFGVRFSLYLASCLPDFFCVWFFFGGGEQCGDQKKRGGTNLKKGGDWSPCFPPPPPVIDNLANYFVNLFVTSQMMTFINILIVATWKSRFDLI